MIGFKKGVSSIRSRIVLIYFLLVFIATTIIGVFIMDQLESYYLTSLRQDLSQAVERGSLLSALSAYDSLEEHREEIQESVDAWAKSLQQEIFVINESLLIIASSNGTSGKSAADILDQELILKGLGGESGDVFSFADTPDSSIPTMGIIFPVGSKGTVRGALYLRADLTQVYNTIDQSKEIFLKAMIIALAVTVALGFFIARSITVPINSVTRLARNMAEGDFSQEVSVRSNDEIGRLAEMFNTLRLKLDETLTEISNEKSKLETILKYMADGLLAIDLSGRIIHANPAALSMLHTTAEELEEQSYDQLIRDINPGLVLSELMNKCRLVPAEESFEFGGSIYAARYDHFRDESGADVGIILVLQDITQRQKVERMQMDFVANVSHELKTPLTTIKSYTETLLDGALDSPELARSFLGIVDAEADRMNRLVKDLLQLSRLDYGQESIQRKHCDLTQLTESALTKVELTVSGKKQHLNRLYDRRQEVWIVGDPDRIDQVLLNILSNAIKYTQEGGRIDVDARLTGRRVILTVADNGMGIPVSEQSRVFERFFRVDKARSREMGGTGLGLAISKQIVEEHGGDIRLESVEGRGTKVYVSLPLAPIRGESNID